MAVLVLLIVGAKQARARNNKLLKIKVLTA